VQILKQGTHMLNAQLRLSLTILTVLLLAGCPSLWTVEKSAKEPTAEELFQQGEDHFKNKEYTQAVEAYQRLKSAHPDFAKVAVAYVKEADGLYADRQYDKAISRYAQFVELYPGHPYVPRAKYQIAMSYFNQIKNTDLDNTILQRAAEAFKQLAADPKAGEWSKKAKEKSLECKKKQAEKEMEKARTYVGMGNYKAAKLAAQRVLDQYPKLGFDDEAKDLVNRAKDK
jgi:outer membrane protein assembly factor BamD